MFLNEKSFFVNSVGGSTKITHHTFIHMFNRYKIKFYVLPNLIPFHGIVGNDSLKLLKAVIHIDQNFMLINSNIKVNLKQQIANSVYKLKVQDSYVKPKRKNIPNSIDSKFSDPFFEPDKKFSLVTPLQNEFRTTIKKTVFSKHYPISPQDYKYHIPININKLKSSPKITDYYTSFTKNYALLAKPLENILRGKDGFAVQNI